MKFDDQADKLIFNEIIYKKILDDAIAHTEKLHAETIKLNLTDQRKSLVNGDAAIWLS